MDDSKRVLDDAVAERRPARVARAGSTWRDATLVRIESGGLVVNVPGHGMRGGEEARLWLEHAGMALHFEASVLRTSVPVPDRGGDGILLGFLSAIPTGKAPPVQRQPTASDGDERPTLVPSDLGGPVLDIKIGNSALSLLRAPVALVEVGLDHLMFEVPRGFVVMFPENGSLYGRMGASANDATDLVGRVRLVATGDARMVYRVDITEIADPAAHRRAIDKVASIKS